MNLGNTDFKKDNLSKVFNFVKQAAQVKQVPLPQHSSHRRDQDNLAQHSWHLALAVMAITPHLDIPIDFKKAFKLAIIHGLYHAIGPKDTSAQRRWSLAEHPALQHAYAELDGIFGYHLAELITEYQEQTSYESRVVSALSCILANVGHQEAGSVDRILEQAEEFQYHTGFDQGIANFNRELMKSLCGQAFQLNKSPLQNNLS